MNLGTTNPFKIPERVYSGNSVQELKFAEYIGTGIAFESSLTRSYQAQGVANGGGWDRYHVVEYNIINKRSRFVPYFIIYKR